MWVNVSYRTWHYMLSLEYLISVWTRNLKLTCETLSNNRQALGLSEPPLKIISQDNKGDFYRNSFDGFPELAEQTKYLKEYIDLLNRQLDIEVRWRVFEFIECNPLAENFACAWSRDTRAIFSNLWCRIIVDAYNFLYFLARVFGNLHFIPCYLPLFPFDLFGLNLEF